MKNYLLIGAGGFAGANARYWLGVALSGSLVGVALPVATLLINVTGSLVIGFILGLYERLTLRQEWRLLLVTGFLGAYTTFSSFSYETFNLIRQNEAGLAALYVLLSLVLGMLAVLGGFTASRLPGRVTK